jgi:hypothetical protein
LGFLFFYLFFSGWKVKGARIEQVSLPSVGMLVWFFYLNNIMGSVIFPLINANILILMSWTPKPFSKFKLFQNYPGGDRIVQRRCDPLRFLLLTPARSLLPRLG